MPIETEHVERARGWLDAVEAGLVAAAEGRIEAPIELSGAELRGGIAAVAAKFLAVGTPRTLGLVLAGARAAGLVAAQCAYAAPRELRVHEEDGEAAAALAASLAGPGLAARATSLREACACDIVVVAGPAEIRREWIRAGTLLTVLAHNASLEPSLLAAAVVFAVGDRERDPDGPRVHATLAAVAAGLVDGRQLDEIIVLLPPAT
ncbi:MAG TPA: hypothetical protein VHE35_29525 [Kofleriaceae bacterium]|nr:hypothetical protein [Kofleriaceae bacterium]